VLNGKVIASYTCGPPAPCANDVQVTFSPSKLAKVGAVVSYDFTCDGDPVDPTACTTPGFNATATFYFEPALPASP